MQHSSLLGHTALLPAPLHTCYAKNAACCRLAAVLSHHCCVRWFAAPQIHSAFTYGTLLLYRTLLTPSAAQACAYLHAASADVRVQCLRQAGYLTSTFSPLEGVPIPGAATWAPQGHSVPPTYLMLFAGASRWRLSRAYWATLPGQRRACRLCRNKRTGTYAGIGALICRSRLRSFHPSRTLQRISACVSPLLRCSQHLVPPLASSLHGLAPLRWRHFRYKIVSV